MSLTNIAKKLFLPRQRELQRHINEGEILQKNVLESLINRAQNTEYGRNHLFQTMNGYADFVSLGIGVRHKDGVAFVAGKVILYLRMVFPRVIKAQRSFSRQPEDIGHAVGL